MPLNLTLTWTNQERALEIDHDDPFDPLTEYTISLPMGKYGVNADGKSAWLREDYMMTITTGSWKISDLYVTEELPNEFTKGITTLTMHNPSGFNINVAILIRHSQTPGDYSELISFSMVPLEDNKEVQVDLSSYAKGNYELRLEITDQNGNILNDYSHYITVTDDGSTSDTLGTTTFILIIVVVAIILLIIGMAAFMFLQNRNRKEEEEIREEFECPECHNIVSVDDTVCPNCGAEFEEEAYKCPKCGAMLDPEDEECSECGYDFSDQDSMELDDDEDEDMDISEEFEADEDAEVEMDMEEEEEIEELDEDEED
jgi:RNA polymerase subunit RPABC4/transcription elongation factor Spt4